MILGDEDLVWKLLKFFRIYNNIFCLFVVLRLDTFVRRLSWELSIERNIYRLSGIDLWCFYVFDEVFFVRWGWVDKDFEDSLMGKEGVSFEMESW